MNFIARPHIVVNYGPMHIIGILTGIAILAYWIFRAMGTARDSGVTASWKRKKRWNYDNVNQTGPLDTLTTPLDAATALLVMMARAEVTGEMSHSAQRRVSMHLQNHMQLDEHAAKSRITDMENTLRNINQADTIILPVVRILRDGISRTEAKDLYAMMEDTAELHETLSSDRKALMRSYRERMGLDQ